MTDSELRVKVAELCGWHHVMSEHGEQSQTIGMKGPMRGWMPVPDYPNDLNAMHEAEKILTGGQAAAYWRELEEICGGPYQIITSTARQRAEAFVKATPQLREVQAQLRGDL